MRMHLGLHSMGRIMMRWLHVNIVLGGHSSGLQVSEANQCALPAFRPTDSRLHRQWQNYCNVERQTSFQGMLKCEPVNVHNKERSGTKIHVNLIKSIIRHFSKHSGHFAFYFPVPEGLHTSLQL